MRQAVRLITFDVTNTILKINRSVGHQYALIANNHNIKADPNSLNKSFRQVWKKKNQDHPNFGSLQQMSCEEWWTDVVTDCFKSSGYDYSQLPLIAKDLYSYFETPDAWEIDPEAHDTLRYIKDCGICVGVISNFDERLEKILKNLKLNQDFDFILSSKKLGVAKPSPEIFNKALDLVHCHPSEGMHVGDNYENDFKGALDVGMNALLLVKEKELIPPHDLNSQYTIHHLNEIKNYI